MSSKKKKSSPIIAYTIVDRSKICATFQTFLYSNNLLSLPCAAETGNYALTIFQPVTLIPFSLSPSLSLFSNGNHLINEPFKEPTVLDHSNAELVGYLDPHCI